MTNLKCSKCGCDGIHACMGQKQKPMSRAAKKHFDDAIKLVVSKIKARQQLNKTKGN